MWENNLITVTSNWYVEILWTFLEPKLIDLGSPDVWFQQDGATVYMVIRSMEAVREKFPGHFFLTQ